MQPRSSKPWPAPLAKPEQRTDDERPFAQNRSELEALNARLILLLANHIGDLRVLREALAAAKSAV